MILSVRSALIGGFANLAYFNAHELHFSPSSCYLISFCTMITFITLFSQCSTLPNLIIWNGVQFYSYSESALVFVSSALFSSIFAVVVGPWISMFTSMFLQVVSCNRGHLLFPPLYRTIYFLTGLLLSGFVGGFTSGFFLPRRIM